MNSETKKRQIIGNYVKAYNTFQVEEMVKNLHPGIVFENISNGTTTFRVEGAQGFRQQAEAAVAYFSEREQKIKAIRFNGDVAEVEIDYKGVVATDLPNGVKAGEKLSLSGKSIFYFEGDKIVKLQDIS